MEEYESRTRYQNYANSLDEEQAKDNNKADLQYTGTLSHLRHTVGKDKRVEGKKGKGYYVASEDVWYFTPDDDTETYRIKPENLDFTR